MRLLCVEDNKELAGLIAKGLERAGYEVDVAETAGDARIMLDSSRYAALVLDLGLPDIDGRQLLRERRAQDDPILTLVLTARSGVPDRIAGLRDGADDYLVKPFAFEELLARIEALLRRPGFLLGRSLRLGNLTFDTVSKDISVNGALRQLSHREGSVLELLIRRAGRVVPKSVVEDDIFGQARDVGSNAIEVYVHRLRKQLADCGAGVSIHTVRGVGYMLSANE